MKRVLLVSAAVAMAASAAFGQARVIGLGGNKYIDDASRVFENPAKVGEYKDMLYGESGSRVFGTFNLFDGITLGVSAPRALAHPFAYDSSSLGAPGGDNLHFLLGVGPLGFEVSSEGKSRTNETVPATGATIDRGASIRSYDLKGGINLSFLDAAVGLGYITESDRFGSGIGIDDEISGSGISLNADGSIMFGGETRMGAYAHYGIETFQEEQTTTIADTNTTTVVNPSHSQMVARAGFIGEFQIANPAKFYVLAGVGLNRTAAAADTGANKTTTTSYVLPEVRAGLEYDLGKVWKIENVLLRAGASKVTTTPVTTTVKTATTETTNKLDGNPGATVWTLGAGMRQGNFSLDAVVAPGSLNGIYFLNGAGPNLASITLSYKFRGGSSSSSSSSSSYETGSSYSPDPSNGVSSEESSSISSEPATLP